MTQSPNQRNVPISVILVPRQTARTYMSDKPDRERTPEKMRKTMAGRLGCCTALVVALGCSLAIANDECGLYMAVSGSSDSDEQFLGLYAGVDLPKGFMVGYPDLAINLLDVEENTQYLDGDDEYMALVEGSRKHLERHVLMPDPVGARFEVEFGDIYSIIAASGSIGGESETYRNARWSHIKAYNRPSIGEHPGAPHPGRGAVSTFFNVVLETTKFVKAGTEIFLDFSEDGDDASQQNESIDLHELAERMTLEFADLQGVSTSLTRSQIRKRLADIENAVERMIIFFENHGDRLSMEQKEETYAFMVDKYLYAALSKPEADFVVSMLPKTADELKLVRKANGIYQYYTQGPETVSDSWLRQHGVCTDNIEPGPSTVRYAGRGAFSTRPIKSGRIIAPAPLIHIPHGDIFKVFKLFGGDEGEEDEVTGEVLDYQLALNYCYGHPESTALFLPVGAAVNFINHSKEKANARMEWSTHPSHQKLWFNDDPSASFEKEPRIGLIMNIVAIRDIEPGEEIFIDYGDDWQDAWDSHVEEWEEMVNTGEIPPTWPIRAVDLTAQHRKFPFRTPNERKLSPNPPNVVLKVFVGFNHRLEGTRENPTPWALVPGATEKLFDPERLVSAEVVERTETNGVYSYTVRWWTDNIGDRFVSNVPHEALVFVDLPEMGDQFLEPGLAFRHYIGIPDDVFPQGPWRNRDVEA